MKIIAVILCCALFWKGGTVYGDNKKVQSLESILLQSELFVQQFPYQSPYPAGFTANKLDSRLRLTACNQSLDIAFSNQGKTTGNTSLKIQCPSPVKWHLFLPVRISLFDDVLVASKPLYRGQTIDANDYKYAKVMVSSLQSGFIKKSVELNNLTIKRNINRGEALTQANLKPRMLIKSGQKVTILLSFKGLSIKSTGIALQSAQKGQVIRVKNNRSNKIIEGVVSAEGQIRVSL